MIGKQRLGNEFGIVLAVTDMRDFLATIEPPARAYSSAREALGQLLQRVEAADFICLICKKRRGQCRCVTQGTQSMRYPGVWTYYNAAQRWAVTRASIVSLTADDLAPLSNLARQRVQAWRRHLQKRSG